MKTIKNIGDLENINKILEGYSFQPLLTKKLDANKSEFKQTTINEIVLWKTNRYAEISKDCFNLINRIDPNDLELNENLTTEILTHLLSTKGIRLPIASTILRFKAPNIYQIYDKRVFRYIYGSKLKYSTILAKEIATYIKYLQDLRELCQKYDIEFMLADRILYQADKIQNSRISINY